MSSTAKQSGQFQGYHERKAQEAWDAFAGPFKQRMIAKYRGTAKNASDLHVLSRECWKEHDYAWGVIARNGYDNMTRHGCMPYDRYSALAEVAKAYAIEFYNKAKRIEAGEAPDVVMPHLAKATGAA